MPRDQRAYVERMIGLLVDFFGQAVIEEALAAVTHSASHRSINNGRKATSHKRKRLPNGKATFSSAREDIPEMRTFLEGIERGELLPQAEDVRQLASVIGIKGVSGRSRRDLLRSLLHSLDKMSIEQIVAALHEAPHITAAIRREGFAVLTNKLLEDVAQNTGFDPTRKPERRR